ncbi:MAG: DUF4190 domain-containing protein [Nocardioidaceae bacterium]
MTNPPGDGPTPPEEPTTPQQSQPGPGQEGPGQPGPGQPGPGQPGQEQPGYWQQQAQGQQPPYPPPGYPAHGQVQYAPDHPKATTSLVLGILGVVLCQVIAPFAWSMGKRTLNEIDASQGRLGGRGAAQAGYVLGIVGTVLLGLSLVFILIYVIGMVAFFSSSSVSS